MLLFYSMADDRGPLEEYIDVPHYHGDAVRIIFVICGVIMLLGLPKYQDLIPFSANISILSILFLAVVAGYTNPKQKWIGALDALVSTFGFAVSEYLAVTYFRTELIFTLINQVLAVLFFIALYSSIKTLRAFLIRNKNP